MKNTNGERLKEADNTIAFSRRLMEIAIDEKDVGRQVRQVKFLLGEAVLAANFVSSSQQSRGLNPPVDRIDESYPIKLFAGAFDLAKQITDPSSVDKIRQEIVATAKKSGFSAKKLVAEDDDRTLGNNGNNSSACVRPVEAQKTVVYPDCAPTS
jgi:hypothetical protein